MQTIEQLALKHYNKQKVLDNTYTYEKSLKYIKHHSYKKQMEKIDTFNKNINLLDRDNNNIPKIIHLTCKDKNKITNKIWIECLNKIRQMYHDYKIIIYDNNDIYKITETFDKKNLGFIKNITIGATLADLFRYFILYTRGGYYFDLDCEPTKHIKHLSEMQYHGDNKNLLYIYNKNAKLTNNSCDFYSNPCTNCKNINTTNVKNTYKCLGHNYINKETNIIVGYEYDKTWNQNVINNALEKHKWVDNNIGICQWFIGAKPLQPLFLRCYKKSIINLKNIKLNQNSPNYHYDVINGSGPLFFTKMINKFIAEDQLFKNSIAIFPADYFCCGSGGTVPNTKNTFVRHKFTGSWLK
jgi:mannosyltransferase OCH1-like enzyme